MKEYNKADFDRLVISARENKAVRDELLKQKTETALRMIKGIHFDKFPYLRMTEIEKEQEALIAILDVIQDYDPEKSNNFDGYLKWKIMGRLKKHARFQKKHDDRVITYEAIVESEDDNCSVLGERRLISMDYRKYKESGALSAEEYICITCEINDVRIAVERLPEREKEFILWKYGLNGGESHTLEETAEFYNLKKSQAKQIEARAISKLRKELEV